jgi:uncharacterized protein
MNMTLDQSNQVAADRQAGNSTQEINRRSILRGLFLGLGAASVPAWMSRNAFAQPGGPQLVIPPGPLGAQDYGPLVEQVVADNLPTVNHQVWAPAGFNVRVVMRAGINPVTQNLSGTLGHVNPDGGAVYMAADGGWVYVSNSETTPGGVGAIRFDAAGTVIDYYRIAANTRNNCAGGQTPWGTWITCEEVNGGWAFECDPFGTSATQRRLDALGARNGREAVAIDHLNHVIYQTLDSGSGKFVRFVSDPSDLEQAPNGTTRMRMLTGVTQRIYIPPFGELPGYANVVVPNDATSSARLRQARPIEWLADTGTNGTNFNGGEGIWHFVIPEALRTVPSAGAVPTRGVMFFASKGDNRIWAIDIENNLIELIYDIQNNQAFTNLRNIAGTPSNFNQVDNVGLSPGGDVLVAEDGTNMRLAVMLNDRPAKLLMQITRGGSEIAGPALTPDGSRLYFASQRGPSGSSGTGSSGVIYEMTIPPRFRKIQKADVFAFPERLDVAPSYPILSAPVAIQGFLGPLVVTISGGNDAQFSIDGGAWTSAPTEIVAGQTVRIRHTSAATIGDSVQTTLAVGLANGASSTTGVFRSVTSAPSTAVDPFDFGEVYDVPGSTLVESDAILLTGFNLPVTVEAGPHCEYRIDGGAWTSAPGTLEQAQTLQTRHVSNKPNNAVRTTHLHVGGVTGHFRTRVAPGEHGGPQN